MKHRFVLKARQGFAQVHAEVLIFSVGQFGAFDVRNPINCDAFIRRGFCLSTLQRGGVLIRTPLITVLSALNRLVKLFFFFLLLFFLTIISASLIKTEINVKMYI